MEQSNNVDFAPLDGVNYKKWKEDIELMLGILDYDHVLKEDPPPEPADDATKEIKLKHQEWHKHNRIALIYIKNCITDAVKGGIPESDLAKVYLASIADKYKVSEQGLQIQEVPVSSSKDVVEHSKNDAETGYVPIKRPDQGTLLVGRGMYPRVHRREDDLGCGVAAIRGIQQSLKVTSNGLVMCTDYSVIPFRKRMPVLEFLKEHIREIQVVDDIGRFRNKVMAALKGLRVSVTHRRTNQKYIVSGLTEKLTNQLSFELEDLEGNKEPEIVMLTDYFRERWGKEIVHKGIPCLKLGNGKKPNYVPMEFCVLAEDRRFPKDQLGREAARQLKDLCLLPPDFRQNEICSMMREEYGTGSHGGMIIV